MTQPCPPWMGQVTLCDSMSSNRFLFLFGRLGAAKNRIALSRFALVKSNCMVAVLIRL